MHLLWQKYFGVSCVVMSATMIAMAEKDHPGGTQIAWSTATGGSDEPLSEVKEDLPIDQTFDHVQIAWVNGSVSVTPLASESGPAQVHFFGQGQKNHPAFKYRVENRTLIIREEPEERKFFGFVNIQSSSSMPNLNVSLELPAKWDGVVEVKSIDDQTTIGNFHLKELRVKTVGGDVVTSAGFNAKDVEMSSVSGALRLQGQFEHLNLKSVSGEIHLQMAKKDPWDFHLKTISGAIHNDLPSHSEAEHRADIKTISGDIVIR